MASKWHWLDVKCVNCSLHHGILYENDVRFRSFLLSGLPRPMGTSILFLLKCHIRITVNIAAFQLSIDTQHPKLQITSIDTATILHYCHWYTPIAVQHTSLPKLESHNFFLHAYSYKVDDGLAQHDSSGSWDSIIFNKASLRKFDTVN